MTRVRLWAGIALVGILAYILIDATLAVIDPWYSLIHNAESDYGVGPHALLMDFNFLLRCGFSLAAAVAILRVGGAGVALRVGLVGLVTWAIASGALAFFPDNPAGTAPSASGRIHLLLAGLAFVAIAVGTIALSAHIRRSGVRRQIVFSLTGVAWLGAADLVVLLGTARRLAADFGLLERGFLGLEILWMAIAMGFLLTSG